MAEEEEEPKGLHMSLDDLISENRKDSGQRGRGGRYRWALRLLRREPIPQGSCWLDVTQELPLFAVLLQEALRG
jgi:hypothetical protein